MQKPSIGRIVHFIPPKDETGERVAAIITAVHSDSIVNVKAFYDNHDGPMLITSLEFRNDYNVKTGDYWEWPPRVE